MNTLDVTKFGVRELDAKEMVEVDGGFIPLVIFGVAYTASQVAAATGGAF